ncbi:SRPBCC family protein [Streptomyces beihaiensis]|uniref:SRPBCC family protein n=1 Tax=Streptomyces beihaiensis TaxID=2984495 RepID=A0ABT3TY52_9ACTN|nr:SRPBCC family protein [Streptomyces beihaiensis]MCX3061426.1 SRPBCC family protein [Streptomyces beihaiensis]
MPYFEIVTVIAAPPERVFETSLDVEVHSRSMAKSSERVVGGRTRGVLSLGDTVTWQARHFGLTWRLTSRITAYDSPGYFVDEQDAGPFGRWRHAHHFEPDGAGGTVMKDVIDFASPFGLLGRVVDRTVLDRYMRRLISTRNAYLADALGCQKG